MCPQAGFQPLFVKCEPVAQSVEHLTFNQVVDGSSPSGLTILFVVKKTLKIITLFLALLIAVAFFATRLFLRDELKTQLLALGFSKVEITAVHLTLKGLSVPNVTLEGFGIKGTGALTASFWPPEVIGTLELPESEETSGTLGFNLYPPGSAGKNHVLLKNIRTTLAGPEINGINAVIDLKNLDPIEIEKQTISIAQMNAGLPLTEGLVTFSYVGDQISIHDMKWALAKGLLTSKPFTLTLQDNGASGRITLDARDLDLSELFSLTQTEGLVATGTVNGKIPVRLQGDRVFVENGVLETTAPGTIHYAPQDMPSFLQDTASGIINLKAALENFQYEKVKLTINGEAGREQSIKLEARGKNPNFFNGRPVNINLNLGGAIDQIIKYNLGTYKIPDTIQKQIENYERQHAK